MSSLYKFTLGNEERECVHVDVIDPFQFEIRFIKNCAGQNEWDIRKKFDIPSGVDATSKMKMSMHHWCLENCMEMPFRFVNTLCPVVFHIVNFAEINNLTQVIETDNLTLDSPPQHVNRKTDKIL